MGQREIRGIIRAGGLPQLVNAPVRMVVETVFSMLTYVCDFKHSRHKVWDYFETKLGFTMALFNILVQWHGFQPDENGFVPLSIAEFSL